MIKKILLAVLCVLGAQNIYAQMDDRFYYPDKEWLGLTGEYEDIVFVSAADTVHAVLFRPDKDPVATILYFHGNGGNISKWVSHVRPLLDAGMQVCMMDYRGYGRSTGTPTHLNIATDARELYSVIINRPDVEGMPFIVYGASIGSQVASLIARENNERIGALVLDGAMESFTEVAVATSPPEQADLIRQYVPSPYSAKENVPELRDVKLLFIHSEEDPIPLAGARRLYDSAVCEKEFWLYEGPHVMAPVLYPEELVRRIKQLAE